VKALAYECPHFDHVIRAHEVKAEIAAQLVETIEEAVELYLAAFRQQFTGQYQLRRRADRLSRFVTYLKEQNHSLRLVDLTYEDGRAFLDTRVNDYTGGPLSPSIWKGYKSALRSLSRFLRNAQLLIFFDLMVE
jgi:hypothetical protein